MEYKWNIWQPSEEERVICKELQRDLSISEASALLLVRRGISSAEEARAYIRPSFEQLHDPFLMRDMDKAVARLNRALAEKERIMVYGDYDVDGTTAVALVYSILSRRTEELEFYIPDRYTEGYGISFKGIDQAKADGCTLIVALDCGIKATDKVHYASEHGIDFIICDHHTPGEELPRAAAVLNMKRADCQYPYKDLSGCGVGFKLMQALLQSEGKSMEELEEVLPLLSMSIASDIVPMTGENRVLTYFGLRRINSRPTVGVKSLLDVAGVSGRVTIHDLAYKTGPRINASGRLYSGAHAVKLLLSQSEQEAKKMAEEINSYNLQRRDFDQRTTEEALEMLAQDPDNEKRATTVVYSPSWHKGVVGIAASRLMESYYRPTIVLTKGENGIISGSARSVSDFDIYTAIDSCRDLLTNFGGHLFAAGLSMREENLAEFKQRFEKYVSEHINDEQKMPSIAVEQEITLADITPQFFNIICHLEPFGPGNPRPVFLTRHLINNRYTKRVGDGGKHLKLDLTDMTAAISGIAFSRGEMALHIQNGNAVDVCYCLEENNYQNIKSIQMIAQDIKPCSTKETPKDLPDAEAALK